MVHIDREGWGQMLWETARGMGGGRYGKNCSNHCGGRLQRHTRPRHSSTERKVISNSIIFYAGGNSEQMATIDTGLISISTHRARPFLRDKFTVASWGFHPGGEVCQQVNGIRDTTDVQRVLQQIPSDSIISQCSRVRCLFVWLVGYRWCFCGQKTCPSTFAATFSNDTFHLHLPMSVSRSPRGNDPSWLWRLMSRG